MSIHRLVQEMAERVRQITEEPDDAARLQRAVTAAVELVAGCSSAGITVVEGQVVTTAAATDDVALQGDLLQHELGEGPCLDSLRHGPLVVSGDVAADRRWPAWAPSVHQLGVAATASLRLSGNGRTFGALTLYGGRRGALDGDDLAVACALATHISMMMASSHEIRHLGIALDSRTVIGQAQGLVMERYGLSAGEAFALLQRVSQHDNRKLFSIASELVSTRQLALVPQPSSD
ncbi:GAF and ANTAR domain-containing protein [Auraticoccus monumenti]|uniref:GAF domain-containing protein n=1 Tax=Auraticoccus monumenti TaxID=675864 RepID=A0A1G6VLT7_9ACTN|nr:GAF and ANTAR domain-containing protein [Auraticoccus monumenti]SDD53806.1 GAF domain-containing protein [Auraticoccus monumenti]